jgi:acyl transferase domain-containing protein
MDGRGNHGESVAIIGMACRFPGARDPAEFHDLAVAGRGMFQPAAARRSPGAAAGRADAGLARR